MCGFNMGINVSPAERWSVDVQDDRMDRQMWLIKRNDNVCGRLLIDVCNVSVRGMRLDIDGKCIDVQCIDGEVSAREHRGEDRIG